MEQDSKTDDQEKFLFFENKAKKIVECGVYSLKMGREEMWREERMGEIQAGRGRKLPKQRDCKKEEMKEKFFTEYGIASR